MKKNLDFTGICAALLLAGLLISGCSKGKPGQAPPKMAVPVAAGTAVRETVPVEIKAIGNIEAYSTVAVKSQIGGELIKVHFTEGHDVNKGDLLFTIDPRPYEASLRQAEANLAKDAAQMENAKEEERRYSELVGKGYVSRSQYDQARTTAAALEAAANADKAVAENARLQLSYCFIHSPISGRTGSIMSDTGNIIKANADTPMIVINQIRPVYASFSVPEQRLAEVKKYMTTEKVKVSALIGKDEENPVNGFLTFVDNAVDAATGTIKLRATFMNDKKRLWPGQFVNLVMTLTMQPNAIVVSSPAVQTGQGGQYVFVIKDDLSVELRPVVVGRTFGNMTVVEKGLQAGEKVVTDGHLRLVQGAKVEIKNSAGGAN